MPGRGHKCDLILVSGDTLHTLLSDNVLDRAIWNHIDGPLDEDVSPVFIRRDDFVAHLGNVTEEDNLENFLATLLDQTDRGFGLAPWRVIGDELTSISPIMMEYGFDGDPFQDSSDTDPLLKRRGPLKDPPGNTPLLQRRLTGQWSKSLRSGFVSVRRKLSSSLRPGYCRMYSPASDSSSKGECIRGVEGRS
jgi:hypothetical protein